MEAERVDHRPHVATQLYNSGQESQRAPVTIKIRKNFRMSRRPLREVLLLGIRAGRDAAANSMHLCKRLRCVSFVRFV